MEPLHPEMNFWEPGLLEFRLGVIWRKKRRIYVGTALTILFFLIGLLMIVIDRKMSFLDHNISQMWQSFGKNITGKINSQHKETSSLLQELEQKYNLSTNEVIRKIEEQEEIQLNQTRLALNHNSNKMKQLLKNMANENKDMNLKQMEKIEYNYRTLIEEMIITNETLDVFDSKLKNFVETINHSI